MSDSSPSVLTLSAVFCLSLTACTETRVRKVSVPGFGETYNASRRSETRSSTTPRRQTTPIPVKKHDLRTAPEGTYYTLQIAHYENPDNPAERRKRAEEYAQQLREQGEQAFYYHGPNMSLVTVGAFKDAVLRVGSVSRRGDGSKRLTVPTPTTRYSPEVEELQAKYPHHLHNGRPIYYKKKDGGYMTYPPGHPKAGQRIAQGCRPVRIPGRRPPL
ncbi:MAG: hypothetical protein R3236_07625 [Phycisphaeraceae bacterium]|nr:hypothetical protein [Phycisphaeraceae bacterium]